MKVTGRPVEIRPYRPGDEALLFGLARLDRGADERTLGVLEHDTVFVAEVNEAPAGYVALTHAGRAACIDQLFVSPEREAQGVGRRLLEHAEGWAISKGAGALQVVVEPGNDRALAFYRSRGFVPAGGDRLELVLPGR